MNLTQVNRFISNGQAFIPLNMENNVETVQLIFSDGSTEIINIRCETFLKKLLIYFGTSMAANRQRYGELVGKSQLVPLVLSYGFTLIPYHVKKLIGGQKCVGWFLAKEITHLQARSPRQTIIQLSNTEVSVYHSKKFCLDQLKNAKWIEHCYGKIHEPHRKEWPLSKEIF